MSHLGPPSSALLPLFLVLLIAPTLPLFASSGPALNGRGSHSGGSLVRAEPAAGRWGQSSFLLNPSDSPTLVVVSGKTYLAGQTVDSSATSANSFLLSLSSPIEDLASPSWTTFAGPVTQFSSSVPLSASAALTFGGDATGSSTSILQTRNDSAWLLCLPSNTSSTPNLTEVATWTQEPTAWANQPTRRQQSFATSATNGTASRAWIFGGLKADGSDAPYDELWEFGMNVGDGGAVSLGRGWAQGAATGPPAMYDGTAVLVPAQNGGQPSIYLIGGVQVESGTTSLASLAEVWVFTPNDELAGGAWSQVAMKGAPTGRRGHVALDIGDGKIWIQGGRNVEGSTILSDAAVLDTSSKAWTATSAGQQVWGHSAVVVGSTVLLAFGYGSNAPASTTLNVYAPANDSWLLAYHPSFAATSSTSSSSNSLSIINSAPLNPKASATSSGRPSHTTAGGWSNPGAAPSANASSPSDPNSNPTSSSSSKSNKSSNGPVIGGAIGAVLGALAVAGALLLVRKRRRRRGHYTTPSSRRGRGGWHAARGEGSGSLMAEHHRTGSYGIEEAVPVAMRHPVTVRAGGVRNALSSILGRSGAAGGAGSTRFDMLRDEGSEKWATPRARDGWETFDEKDDAADDAHELDFAGRGGMGVWRGFGTPNAGGSESIQSHSSFLTGALGAFVPAGQHVLDDGTEDYYDGTDLGRHGPGELEPIAEWDEDRRHDDDASSHSRGPESAETHSSQSHPSRLSVPLSISSDPYTASQSTHSSGPGQGTSQSNSPYSNASRVLASPPPSLHGSLFAFPPSPDGPAPSNLSHAPSNATSRLKRNSTWWSRLSKPPSLSDTPTSTSSIQIRDPAPAPPLGKIEESPNPDPFADSNARRALSAADEQGRLPRDRDRRHDYSQSSTGTLDTVTSSVMEERMKDMDVVQRVQTGSLNGSEVSFASPVQGYGFSRVRSQSREERTPGSIVWNGPTVPLPTRTGSPDPFLDPPPSPTRRVLGPRPLSPTKLASALPPLPSAPLFTSSSSSSTPPSGVKALIQRIETAAVSTPTSPRPLSTAPSPSIPTSTSFPNVRKATLDFEKPGVVSPVPSPTRVVRHGLAKKPRLYVANPDGSEG